MQEIRVQSLGWEDPLEEGIATHSSILAWRIPWTESLAGHSPWRSNGLECREGVAISASGHSLSGRQLMTVGFFLFVCFLRELLGVKEKGLETRGPGEWRSWYINPTPYPYRYQTVTGLSPGELFWSPRGNLKIMSSLGFPKSRRDPSLKEFGTYQHRNFNIKSDAMD